MRARRGRRGRRADVRAAVIGSAGEARRSAQAPRCGHSERSETADAVGRVRSSLPSSGAPHKPAVGGPVREQVVVVVLSAPSLAEPGGPTHTPAAAGKQGELAGVFAKRQHAKRHLAARETCRDRYALAPRERPVGSRTKRAAAARIRGGSGRGRSARIDSCYGAESYVKTPLNSGGEWRSAEV